ncbi:hypothetical protein DIPPA_11414 [Diplonema papillatum]|nr:hypothetical protein DIPPA_11414 [Diplonema papillatum]
MPANGYRSDLSTEGSDVVAKLHAIYQNLNERMVGCFEAARRRRERDRKDGVACDGAKDDHDDKFLLRELKKRDQATQEMETLLLDLKAVFEYRKPNGDVGVGEAEFLDTFGTIFLPGVSDGELAQWFTGIDYDANGFVGWDEFCCFLVMSNHLPSPDQKDEFFSTPQVFDADSNKDTMTHILHNSVNDVFYSASLDGVVRMWNADIEEQGSKAVHCATNGAFITDLRWNAQMNRLIVLQNDRTVSVYDCGMMCRSRRSGLLKTFKGVDNFTRDFTNTKPMVYRLADNDPGAENNNFGPEVVAQLRGKEPVKAKGKGKHSLLEGKAGLSEKDFVATDAIPLYDLGVTTLTVDYAPWCAGGSYFMGTEGGTVNYYNTKRLEATDDEQSNLPTARWQCHESDSYVTRLLAVESLDGFISSSTDETVQILNIEKGRSYVRMKEPVPSRLGNASAKRGNRAVFGFDYSPELNLLVSWGENRRFVVWNPQTATLLFHRTEHTHPVSQVMFKPNHQLVSLSVDKTIKIWDVRTFRCVQTLVDKRPRASDEQFKCLAWDNERSSLVTGGSALVAFRMRSVQERIEAGLSAQKQVAGHVRPVSMVVYNPRFNHLVTIDKDNILTWNCTTGQQLAAWSPDFLVEGNKRLTAVCLAYDCRRLVVSADDNCVYLLNYVRRTMLRTYNTSFRDELAHLLSIEVRERVAQTDGYIIAAGMAPKIVVFKDDIECCVPWTEHLRPSHLMTLDRYGHATSVHHVLHSRLAVGTSKGFMLVYSLNNMSLISVCNEPTALGGQIADSAGFMRQAVVAATGKTAAASERFNAGLLSGNRVFRAVSKARMFVGASAFTAFHRITQKNVASTIENLALLSPTTVATLHGNGDLCVWWLSKDTLQAKVLSSVPASHGPGEGGCCMVWAPSLSWLIVGDNEGYVSVFDMGPCLAVAKDDALSSSGVSRPTEKNGGKDKAASDAKGPSSPAADAASGVGPPKRLSRPTEKPGGKDKAASDAKGPSSPGADAASGVGSPAKRLSRPTEKNGGKDKAAGDAKGPSSPGADDASFSTARGEFCTDGVRFEKSGAGSIRSPSVSSAQADPVSRTKLHDAGGPSSSARSRTTPRRLSKRANDHAGGAASSGSRTIRNDHFVLLSSSWYAHCGSVNTICLLPSVEGEGCGAEGSPAREYVVTGGSDCMVRLWTMSGRLLMTFGDKAHASFNLAAEAALLAADERRGSGDRARAHRTPRIDAQGGIGESSVDTHYFTTRFPGHANHNNPNYAAVAAMNFDALNRGAKLGDIFAAAKPRRPKKRGSAMKQPPAEGADDAGAAAPRPDGVTVQLPSISMPLKNVPAGPALDGSPGSPTQMPPALNVRRMLEYSLKRTNDPKVALDLQRMDEEQHVSNIDGSIHLALERVRQRQRNRNPLSSQYSNLTLRPPEMLMKTLGQKRGGKKADAVGPLRLNRLGSPPRKAGLELPLC